MRAQFSEVGDLCYLFHGLNEQLQLRLQGLQVLPHQIDNVCIESTDEVGIGRVTG